MRIFSTLLAAFALLPLLTAQQAPNFFTPVKPHEVQLGADAVRLFEPKAYRTFRLDYPALIAHLATAPLEQTAAATTNPCRIQLPAADGSWETFVVELSPVMESGIQGRYPEIRTYRGVSAQTPGKICRLIHSPYHGLHVMITRADKGGEHIERVANGQDAFYMAYDQLDYPWELAPRAGGYPDPERTAQTWEPRYAPGAPAPAERGAPLGEEVVLKSYRLAISTTGEFSQDNGGTKPAVLAKIADIVMQMNVFYERDLAVRMLLINEQENCIWLDPATDPFGVTVGEWLSANALALLQALGDSDKYDIGHVFGRYLGGSAAGVGSLGVVCTQLKARGASSGTPPYGIDFMTTVGQEIGHQWGAAHTWNHCGSEPADNNTATCEPGAGNTIMSYAGLCGVDNISGSGAEPYYHACSIFEIRNFIENGIAGSCGTNTPTGNFAPMPTILDADNLFIPISTPFELHGTGMDPDGDVNLSYSWDQIDLGPSDTLGQVAGSAPSFRWFQPSDTAYRVFPRIQTIITNTNSISEVLPTYSRDLTFALVMRDNEPGGGGIGFDTITLRSTASAGPFRVTYPNASGEVWRVGELRTITWDVANTNQAPVNCQSVDIYLSTNTGLNFPVLLASDVPNTGAYCVQVPNNLSGQVRIKVKGHDNVFFDLSNTNLTIQASAQPGFAVCSQDLFVQQCLPDNFSTTISTAGWAGFSSPISLSVSGVPAGATATFSATTIQPGDDATLNVSFPAGFAEGTYTLTVTGTSGASTSTSSVQLTVVSNDFSAFSLAEPANGMTIGDFTPVVSWNTVPDANAYDVQVATNPAFGQGTLVATLSDTPLDSFQVPVLLQAGQVYFWRVRPKNECGTGAWSEPSAFAVAAQNCQTYTGNSLPLVLSSTGTPVKESMINVNANATLTDVNVKRVSGSHQGFNQLKLSLIAPNNAEIVLFQGKCGPNFYNFDLGFDSDAVPQFTCPPVVNGTPVKPQGNLNSLIGLSTSGTWTLRASDNAPGQQGSVQTFELELCAAGVANPPVVVTNNALQLAPGTNAVIGNTLLKAEDPDNTASQLTYTLLSVPTHGDVQRDWSGAMKVGDQFTQADIDAGAIRYFHYGSGGDASDEFRFAVTDGGGGLVVGTFVIDPLPVSTHLPDARIDFALTPNPASGVALLTVPEALSSDTRVAIVDGAGRQLREWIVPAGARTRQLELNGLPAGLYAVTVRNAQAMGTKKLVIQ